LNLSTYLEQEEELNRSVSIAMQTGNSIKGDEDFLRFSNKDQGIGPDYRDTLGQASVFSYEPKESNG
jgi:hypothetical protein